MTKAQRPVGRLRAKLCQAREPASQGRQAQFRLILPGRPCTSDVARVLRALCRDWLLAAKRASSGRSSAKGQRSALPCKASPTAPRSAAGLLRYETYPEPAPIETCHHHSFDLKNVFPRGPKVAAGEDVRLSAGTAHLFNVFG